MRTFIVRRAAVVWSCWLIAALLALDVLDLTVYGVVVPLSALVIALVVPGVLPPGPGRRDRRDLLTVAVLYVGVVALFRTAFTVFTTDHTAGLFLTFAAGLLLGVVGPVYYTVWRRGRPLADLGLGLSNWRPAVALGLGLGAVQFSLTLWGYQLPRPVDWVPLLVMSLVVGFFEAVFFRGFIQTRLQASIGTVPGIAVAAILYGLYHVGYGMSGTDLVFLAGLGVVYGIAFAVPHSVLVLWPLLTPLGSLFNNLENGDIQLPWASIVGFAEVFAAMLLMVWLAARHEHHRRLTSLVLPDGGLDVPSADSVRQIARQPK